MVSGCYSNVPSERQEDVVAAFLIHSQDPRRRIANLDSSGLGHRLRIWRGTLSQMISRQYHGFCGANGEHITITFRSPSAVTNLEGGKGQRSPRPEGCRSLPPADGGQGIAGKDHALSVLVMGGDEYPNRVTVQRNAILRGIFCNGQTRQDLVVRERRKIASW